LDLTRRAEPPAEKEPFELPSHLPPLSIDTFKGEVKLEAGRRVEIDGETLTVVPGLPDDAVRLHLPAWRLLGPEGLLFSSDLELSARYAQGLVELQPLRLDELSAEAGSRVDLSRLVEDKIEAELRLASPFGHGDAVAELREGLLTASLDLEELDLEPLGRRLGLTTPLQGKGTLEAEARLPAEDALAGSGQAHLAIENAVLGPTRWQSVEGEVRWADRSLSVPTLTLRQAGNRILGRVEAFPLADLSGSEEPWNSAAVSILRQARGELEADLSDVPGLLRTSGVGLPQPLAGPVPRHRLRLSGDLSQGTLRLSEGTLEVQGGGRLELQEARFTFLGDEPGQGTSVEIQLAATASFTDLAPVGRIFQSPDPWGGRVEGRLAVAGRPPDLQGEAMLEGRGG
ncbi:MAG: hypothetical protein KDD47_22240, partial [Acidobacteria bacterium]|nr:hypothetical protein [Acidobacteriota bacterium]